MSQRIALFLSVALTAFVLVFIGAAISIGRQGLTVAQSPTLDPQLLAALQQREATYQAMIDQANAQLQATTPASTETTTPTTEPSPTTAGFPISPALAAYLAQSLSPNSYLLRSPVLVNFQGTTAYEVALNTGFVYIDATNGAVLYNGTAAVSNSNGSGSGGGGGGGERDSEGD